MHRYGVITTAKCKLLEVQVEYLYRWLKKTPPAPVAKGDTTTCASEAFAPMAKVKKKLPTQVHPVTTVNKWDVRGQIMPPTVSTVFSLCMHAVIKRLCFVSAAIHEHVSPKHVPLKGHVQNAAIVNVEHNPMKVNYPPNINLTINA